MNSNFSFIGRVSATFSVNAVLNACHFRAKMRFHTFEAETLCVQAVWFVLNRSLVGEYDKKYTSTR